MIEVKNHSKYHFRAYNFQNFPGGMPPDSPRLSCYAAELSSATAAYFCYSQPGAARAKSSKLPWYPWPHHQLGSSYATGRSAGILQPSIYLIYKSHNAYIE